MSRDTILTDETGVRYSYDNLRTQGWLDGHASGLDKASEYLRDLAVELFCIGKDEEAIRLRRLADDMVKELRPKMKKRSEDHAKEHPILIKEEA